MASVLRCSHLNRALAIREKEIKMAVNRDMFDHEFSVYELLSIKCWHCGTPLQTINDTFFSRETSDSIRNHEHPNWEPEYSVSVFSGLLTCTNTACAEKYSVIGTSRLEENLSCFDQQTTLSYFEYFKVKYIHPSPYVISIPESCPELVVRSIQSIGCVMFEQFGMAGNRVRASIEQLLSELGCNTSGALHRRIQEFAKVNENVANHLMAIKWLGNISSHDDSITKDEICDALDILERVLQMLYDKNDERVAGIVDKVNQRFTKIEG